MHKLLKQVESYCAEHQYTAIGVIGAGKIATLNIQQCCRYYSSSATLEEITQEKVALYYIYYSVHIWEKKQREAFCEYCRKNAIQCIFVEYSIAERTIEWLCGYNKFLKAFMRSREEYLQLYTFLQWGGISRMLHEEQFTTTHYYRYYATQTSIHIGSFKDERII